MLPKPNPVFYRETGLLSWQSRSRKITSSPVRLLTGTLMLVYRNELAKILLSFGFTEDKGSLKAECSIMPRGELTLLAVLSKNVSSSPMMMSTGTFMLSYGKELAKFMVRMLSKEPLSQSAARMGMRYPSISSCTRTLLSE